MSTTTQATLRTIPDSETFSAVTKYIGQKKVEAVFSIRRDAKSQRYEKRATFDFAGCTDEELHLLAMYACKVKLQALLRAMSPDVMANSTVLQQINVKRDLLEAEKQPSDPISAAVRSIMKATGLEEAGAQAVLADAQKKAAAQKPQQKVVKAA